ncbi:MAG: type 1 glutamine amidotransferase [Deltaproteobacteria bacterium]|nr:type 1 glutamine amidotransferase [Deltaproteobacteria bacterium]
MGTAARWLVVDCYLGETSGAGDYTRHLGQRPWCAVRPGALPAALDGVLGVILTGSEGSAVGRLEPWVEALVQWVRRLLAEEVPVLGVCFGHQVLARAAGGVVRLRSRPEVGWLPVELVGDDPLLAPLGARFTPFLTHGDEVAPHPAYQVLARSEACEVQALRVVGRRAWGVQFHAELQPADEEAFVRQRAAADPALDPAALLSARVDSAPLGAALFASFLALAGASNG